MLKDRTASTTTPKYTLPQRLVFVSFIAELRRAKRAGVAPWVRKFGYDVAYACTLFAGEGRESGVSPSGGGVC